MADRIGARSSARNGARSADPAAAKPTPRGRTKAAPLEGGRARDREVLETAVRIFWEKGYAGASMQDVANSLGMLKGSLYYYVDSKETLLLKIFDDSHAEITGMTESASVSEGAAIDRFAAYLHEYALWTLTHLERAGLFAREWRYAAPPVRDSLAERTRYYNKVLRELIEAAQAEGDVPQDIDARRTAVFLWGAFTSLPDWYRPGRAKPEVVADEYVMLALRTVSAPSRKLQVRTST